MKFFNKKKTKELNINILACSNAIHRGDVLYMRKKNDLTTNGFRNGAVIFLIIMLYALISHFFGNL